LELLNKEKTLQTIETPKVNFEEARPAILNVGNPDRSDFSASERCCKTERSRTARN